MELKEPSICTYVKLEQDGHRYPCRPHFFLQVTEDFYETTRCYEDASGVIKLPQPEGDFVKWDDLASARRVHLDGTFFMEHDEARWVIMEYETGKLMAMHSTGPRQCNDGCNLTRIRSIGRGSFRMLQVAACSGFLFVPGLFPSAATSTVTNAAGRQAEAAHTAEEPAAASAWQGLFGGVALGLLLSVATASPVLAEEAAKPKELTDEEILAKGCDIRVDCKTKEEQFRWAKAYYRKYNRESDGKDPKYNASSTGGGIYRKYKIDQFIEPSGIVNTTDGTYPIRPEAAAFKPIWDEYNKKLIERVEKVYGI
ncbi:CATSPER1, partial [Symbiodinium microadriaticum]